MVEEKKHLKVLLIEDNEGDVRLIWEILSEIRNSPFYLEIANTLLNGLQAIDKVKPDIILLDLSLPDSNGIYTLNRVRDKALNIPIVIITGLDDELTAIKALKEGAQDYLVKGRMDSDLFKKSLLYAYERNKIFIELQKSKEILDENLKSIKWFESAKSNFILNITSGLLNPIIEIKNAISFLEKIKNSKCKPAQMQRLKIIRHNIEKIYNLMNDILDTIKIETGTIDLLRAENDIVKILREVIKNNSKKIKIVKELLSGKILLNIDGYRISRALNILFENAISFSDKNKSIVFGIKKETGDNNYIIYIKIISNKLNSQIFESVFKYDFYKRIEENEEYKSQILNFLICQSIFKAHNWELKIENTGKANEVAFNVLIK